MLIAHEIVCFLMNQDHIMCCWLLTETELCSEQGPPVQHLKIQRSAKTQAVRKVQMDFCLYFANIALSILEV